MNTKRGKKGSVARRERNRRWLEDFEEERLYISSSELTEERLEQDPLLEELFPQDGRGSTDFVEDAEEKPFEFEGFNIESTGISEGTWTESKGQRA